MNILHVAAHLGGGAGKAISGTAIQDQELFGDVHRVLLLQAPEKNGFVQECLEHNIPATLWQGDAADLRWADVIVVSWWNHPSMARFLYRFPDCKCRMLLWSHVNGCHYPHLPAPLARAFDGVLFTSPYSLKNPAWTPEERQAIQAGSALVLGLGRFHTQAVPRPRRRQQGPFVIGYVGTLNYGKLHPHMVRFCEEVCRRIPEARFVMAGDRSGELERDIQAAGLSERVFLPGFVEDVPKLMRDFDVFGYLLNPEHYGTTENVLLEAMACELPPVVLRQNVEQFLVPPGAEYCVDGPEQYGEQMRFLWQHPKRRQELGQRAREHVEQSFNSVLNTTRFQEACRQALAREKREHDFTFLGGTPWQWFLFCLDREAQGQFEAARTGPPAAGRALARTCSPILREQRKSSLRHFAAVYPEDPALQRFKTWMEEEQYGGNQAQL